ncbi:MAG: response regulator transcription factor [Armatimonadota bacterium]|nr:response regulator transcription factor [Armatimonadota bacterium]MDR7486326.1 response regulator transcription factor [Armatimonadota bacterium]MDR7532301.1 response regulator transcription factor [Armatimonadota bacterium]MDR7537226.1 response regulator transcription factor [Armatimonadota bacterium]
MRVLLVDDHTIVREGLRALLAEAPDVEVVGEAADGAEALRKARELRPDVVVMDLLMPGMNGLEATRGIRQELREVEVLVLTMYESDQHFFEVLQAGASGYLLKGASAADLLAALRAVHAGDVFIYPSMAKKLLSDFLTRAGAGEEGERYARLTAREREVLTLVAEGYTAQEIAERLTLSPSTVQTHKTHAMRKLHITTRAQLIRYALRHGLIEREG